MSLKGHIGELEEKHHNLEIKIEEEMTHPGSDTLHITALKRRKLRLKEKILQLTGAPAEHV